MKKIILLMLLSFLIILSSCAGNRSGCGTERDVQRHDSKPFRS